MRHVVTALRDTLGQNLVSTVKEIQELYQVLTPRPPLVSLGFVVRSVTREDLHFLVAREYKDGDHGKIVGIGSVYLRSTLHKTWAVIEDVAVLPEKRGGGIGENIVSELIHFAKNDPRKPIFAELTSRPEPERDSARKLYEKLGFRLIAKAEKDGTNLYRLYF